MKVVLAALNAKYIHTSLALRYLKAYSGHEFDIEIAEYTIKDPVMQVVTELYLKSPDVLGFSCYIWNIEETIKIIAALKQVKPELTIVLGGPEVSYDTEYWLRRIPQADFIVMGEGEATFHQLLAEIRGEGRWHEVLGAAYRQGEEIVVNPPRGKLVLDTIPTPHRFAEDVPALPNRVVYFETSRGCPFNCQFCLSSTEVGVRYFDLDRTKRDLEYLVDSGAKLVKFVDRTFNIRRDYALDIFGHLIKNHGGCTFQFEITADIMRPEVLDFLAGHVPKGLFRFEVGVQSTNDEANRLVERRQNFEKLRRTVNKVKEIAAIDQHLDLIAGLPGEDYASFRKTFNDVFALQPEELQLGFLKLLRGTGLRRDAAKYGYVFTEHAPYEMLCSDALSFGDVIRIKRVEDVLEKYWNSHRLDRSVNYLIGREFASAFDFFQEFGDYWEKRGWSRIGHQLEDLFSRLWAFLQERGIEEPETALALMKVDYFLNHKYKPRKIWWDFTLGKTGQAELLRLAAKRPGLLSPELAGTEWNERELHKWAMVELLPVSLRAYEETGAIVPEETVLLVLYGGDGSAGADAGPRYYTAPLELLRRGEAGE